MTSVFPNHIRISYKSSIKYSYIFLDKFTLLSTFMRVISKIVTFYYLISQFSSPSPSPSPSKASQLRVNFSLPHNMPPFLSSNTFSNHLISHLLQIFLHVLQPPLSRSTTLSYTIHFSTKMFIRHSFFWHSFHITQPHQTSRFNKSYNIVSLTNLF